MSASQQTADGFEALAIDTGQKKILADLIANGGDHITTGDGFHRVNCAAGDGVVVITDFDLANDTLHIAGYGPSHIRVDVSGGDTFIRFADDSADGFVDNATIELSGVTGLNASVIVYNLSTAFPEIG